MSEAAFWNEIRPKVKHRGHWSRIESHATADGFPDTVFTISNVDGFIELKQEDDETKTPEIRSSQVRWFRRAVRNGSNCWLFSKIGRFYLLHDGVHIPVLCKTDINMWHQLSTVVWTDKVDWNEFIRRICR